jgi:hypothetical protein
VPQGTAATLAPAITIEGASVSPASGVSQNFAFLVPYTVTAADGSTAQWIVTVKWEPLAPANIAADIAAYFAGFPAGTGDSAVDPIPLPVNINLASGWTALLTAIQTGGKYVALDLSACTGGAAEFDPGTANTGEDKIVSLILPDAATSIAGDSNYPYAATFENFTALKSVTGGAVASIDDYAFSNCDALETVNFPAAITIGEFAFDGCDVLETVGLPAATSIGNYAFAGCTSLTTVNLPVAATIGDQSFFICTSLTTIDLPAATTIVREAFRSCTALTSVNFPIVTSLGGGAFSYCTCLTSISLPASLTDIGWNPFAGCTNLTNITVATNNPNSNYKVEGGKLLSKDGKTLIGWPTATGNITLPGITDIGSIAFCGIGLTSITLPSAVNIGIQAFMDCTGLETVSLPATANIGGYAFQGCTSLTTVDLPVVEIIDDLAFTNTGTTKALTVTLGPAVPELGTNMFGNVPNTYAGESGTKTVTVTIPDNAAWSGKTGTFTGTENTTGGPHWGEGFRGRGWTSGGAYESGGTVNENITLTIQVQEETP